MNYNLLDTGEEKGQKSSTFAALKKMWGLIRHERSTLYWALAAITINSAISLTGPFLIGHAIDTYIPKSDYHGLLVFTAILAVLRLLIA